MGYEHKRTRLLAVEAEPFFSAVGATRVKSRKECNKEVTYARWPTPSIETALAYTRMI